MDCIFCKIINKEIPSEEIVYEDDKIMAFKDKKPVAPVHILIIPKKHIPSVNHLKLDDKDLIGELVLTAQKIAKELGVSRSKVNNWMCKYKIKTKLGAWLASPQLKSGA